MTEFEKYFTDVLDNKIVSCEKMKLTANMLLENMASPKEFHFDYGIASRHTEFIERFCKTPSGKMGTPLKLELFQKARLQAVFGFVDDNDMRQYNECLIIEGRKNGKALSIETEIPTPDGFKLMKDLEVGNEVFGADGKAYKIIRTSEVFKNHECYKVSFEDGSFLIADAEHIWTVKNRKNKIVNRQTKELLHCKRERRDGKGTEYLYRVPQNKPVEYGEKKLILDPYTLGVWLGDGTSANTAITVSEIDLEETKRNLEEMGHSVKVAHYKERAPRLKLDVQGIGKQNKMLNALRELNVLDNKHIPDIYLHSSIEQRMELLRGLMDTDGFCDKRGQLEFSQKSYEFSMQVRELLSSLGIKNSIRKKQIKCNGKLCTAYSISFHADKTRPCFKLHRKFVRQKDRLNKRMEWKSIVGIEKVESVDCKCIAIDSPDHLYCAGRNFTVTHNTTECAAVELDMLVNDDEGSPQIYNVATQREQATLGFNACHKMVRQSPLLRKHVRKRASDLYFAMNMGYIKALASNTTALDGLDVHMATIDELAAIKNRDLYDLVKQAMGARTQPLLFCISTNGFVRNGIFDSQYEYATNILNGKAVNEHFLPFIYELDSPDEWDQEDCWIKANPGLGTIKSKDYLRQMVQKAKDDLSFKPTVMVKDFNIPQNRASAWLSMDEVENDFVTPNDTKFKYCIGGMDAADSIDLSAAKALCMKPDDEHIYLKSMYWLPQDVIDRWENEGKRQGRDNVPYQLWKDQGFLRTVPGNKVDKFVFLEWFRELRDNDDIYTMYIGYDPWHFDDSLLRAFKNEFGEKSMIPIRQGVATLSNPMKDMRADMQKNLIVHDNNPIDKWCLLNMEVVTDINGNIQPVKGLDSRNRIDGGMALIDGYIALKDHRDEYLSVI